jgi:hypothetical protein
MRPRARKGMKSHQESLPWFECSSLPVILDSLDSLRDEDEVSDELREKETKISSCWVKTLLVL